MYDTYDVCMSQSHFKLRSYRDTGYLGKNYRDAGYLGGKLTGQNVRDI